MASEACPFTDFDDRAKAVTASCCSHISPCSGGTPAVCSMQCTLSVVPYMEQCSSILKVVMSAAFNTKFAVFASRCLSSNADNLINQTGLLAARGCINEQSRRTSSYASTLIGAFSAPATATTATPTVATTRAQTLAQSQLQRTAAPTASAAARSHLKNVFDPNQQRRLQFDELGSTLDHDKCGWDDFFERSKAVNDKCCKDAAGCQAGFATSCTVQCASVFPSFYEDCKTLLQRTMGTKFANVQKTHGMCQEQQALAAVHMISNATCPNCTDGRHNGDEVGLDCGGSCGRACFPPYGNASVCDSPYDNVTEGWHNYRDKSCHLFGTRLSGDCRSWKGKPGWFRVMGAAGTRGVLATDPPQGWFRCGSYRPGWLSDALNPSPFNYQSATLPHTSDGIVNKTICFFGDYMNQQMGPCANQMTTQVISCGDFFLWKINPPKKPIPNGGVCTA